jgi:Polyketide cyclase / dehydrase and lipid transport
MMIALPPREPDRFEVSARPSRVWALVSDLPRMGEYSPESTGDRWVRGGRPSAGAVLRER